MNHNIIKIVHILGKKVSLIHLNNLNTITNLAQVHIDYFTIADIEAIFPPGFKADIIVFSYPEYNFVPVGIENSNSFLVAEVGDWNNNFIHLMDSIKRFDLVITDINGKNLFNHFNFKNIVYFPIFSYHRHKEDFEHLDQTKKYDISFLGSLNHDVQVERGKYLYRVSLLSQKYNVLIHTGLEGKAYNQLMANSKITFNRSIRGELNFRVFEAFLAKSLLFLEDTNQEYQYFFKDRQELVLYNEHNLEKLLEYYLINEQERQTIINNASNFVETYPLANFRLNFYREIVRNINLSNKREFIFFSQSEKKLIHQTEAFKNPDAGICEQVHRRFASSGKIIPNTLNNYIIYLNDIINVTADSNDYLEPGTENTQISNYFQEAVVKFPNNIPLQINFINFLKENKHYKAAVEIIDQCTVILKKNHLEENDFKGILLNEFFSRFIVEYEKAYYSLTGQKLTERLTGLFLWKLSVSRAEIFEAQEKKQEAIQEYLYAEMILSTCSLKNKIGQIYQKQGNFQEAYKYYISGFKTDPFHFKNWYDLITLEAITDYSLEHPVNREWISVIDSSPFFEGYKSIIANYQEENIKHKLAVAEKNYKYDPKSAASLFHKILQIKPDNYLSLICLGNIYYMEKEYQKAIGFLGRALAVKKEETTINIITDCLKELGDSKTLNGFQAK
jgi:tetratricopeptide (TPR) repeat protein